MEFVRASEARRNLPSLIKKVNDDFTHFRISSLAGSAVLVSLPEWNGLQETIYLHGDPRNAARLFESLKQFHAGEIHEQDLTQLALLDAQNPGDC
jgi:antitoxin YefM